MTSYKKLRVIVIAAVVLLVGCIAVALKQFYRLEAHLVMTQSDYVLAHAIIVDARLWLLLIMFIAVIFITFILFILAKDYVVPHHQRYAINKKVLRGLVRKEFLLLYQPQIDLQTKKVVGAEALLRWPKAQSSESPMDQLMSLVEQTPSIISLGEWVINTACKAFQQWQAQGVTLQRVAVNVSATQLKDEALISQIQQAMTVHKLLPHQLEVEVTESMMMQDVQTSMSRLKQLHDLSVPIALDDFGTGHASFQYLKDLPIQWLKIDKVFVAKCHEQAVDYAILKSMIELAHGLNMKVIAEGVENQAQVDVLSALGCDVAQGYFFGKPMTSDALISLSRF